ncbi:DegT/DnrJ/EryC1/StrS family aminotransferase [Gangjinia marincola]|uniref:DegT/DnrJ/EryC1/StrS family aminotransferase n=1 Tax=Gangjinia marincola TaxID=578463 RepID=A0ABN1MDZ1_9FLAO
MNVPFINLNQQYLNIKTELDAAIADVIERSSYINGPSVKKFEQEFAAYLGVNEVIGCGNGTDSLEVLLEAYGIGKGDEVIVPSMSWISTSEVVATAGATPVFVDVDEESYCISAEKMEGKITANTKAIIAVHLYGHPADMPTIMKLAKKHNLKVIEDSAQAHGAEVNGKKIATWGDAGSFSFFPTKNLGAMGDAGGIVLSDKETALTVRKIHNHGQLTRHHHELHGRNTRLDSMQAAVLSVKLKHLDEWTRKRIERAAWYNEELADCKDIHLPKVKSNCKHVYHLFVIRTKKRNELKNFLAEKGIQTLIHYPLSLPFQACYAEMNYKSDDFPLAYQYQDEILSLPLYPELTKEQHSYVCDQIKAFFA